MTQIGAVAGTRSAPVTVPDGVAVKGPVVVEPGAAPMVVTGRVAVEPGASPLQVAGRVTVEPGGTAVMPVTAPALIRTEGAPSAMLLGSEYQGAAWDLTTLGLIREFRVSGWGSGLFTIAVDASDDGTTWRRVKTATAVALLGGASVDLTWAPTWRYARGTLTATVALTALRLHTAALA